MSIEKENIDNGEMVEGEHYFIDIVRELSPTADSVLQPGQRVHIQLPELGQITVNRTHEGVIIDAHNYSDNESIESLAIMNDDFEE
ncbi:hypothetical protein [Litorivivens lipolytica]|uniref:hypothetical protein n=1 Tax=Litorivivens lipolytica TaxID=1524264 RepID=UPI0016204186|nr:hypothetical protein [Litorivivens lipolytica]